MPFHVKKQYVLQEGAWVVPNGVRGCATISTLFPTAFSLSNSSNNSSPSLIVTLTPTGCMMPWSKLGGVFQVYMKFLH